MYVKVRTMDGKQEAILTISKLTEVEDFKREIEKELSIEVDMQRLFFRGKQLENGYKLHDYSINLNDVIQLMVKVKLDNIDNKEKNNKDNEDSNNKSNNNKVKENTEVEVIEEPNLEETESLYYKTGDAVDCLDQIHGAWFEAIIKKIFKQDEKIIYNMQWEFDNHAPAFNVPEGSIRPRARKLIPIEDLRIGQKVMVNHNVDDPKEVGLWYDFTIKKVEKKRKLQELTGTLYIGRDNQLEGHKINPKNGVYNIEPPKLLSERTSKEENYTSNGTRRRVAASCTKCMDDPNQECKECGCRVCGGKEDEHNLLLCDECNFAYHLRCLNPPLISIPEEDYWYCPECKNDENEIVKAGDKLKQSKKKTNTNESSIKRDWGKGMACVGRTKECSIVPPNHRGPIPGVEVGTCWIYRVQVSEVGVHRPHIAGIHGRETDCAYSIVLSGGYEDDIDNGDEFMYTGSGGRDLSGNKRTAGQSCDQTLTRMNKALAVNCNAKLDPVNGATAEDWRGGIPVRVVRNFKLAKHSKYAPKEGNRYDGIYKVVKYYPDTGKSGFRVWRYLLRRDDPAPAPWTREGQARINALGLKPLYPDGYLEAMKKNHPNKKRVIELEDEELLNSKEIVQIRKKQKREIYILDSKLIKCIDEDTANAKIWGECRLALPNGKAAFLQRVSERFTCVCCLEVVNNPVTTPCAHNICLTCLKRSFSSGVHNCPSCRHNMEKDYKMDINESLALALLMLYPGYNVGR